MSDRALQISVGLSLAIHLIASVGLSGDRWTTTVLRPPAQAPTVRVRLMGPPTEPAPTETPRPSVSAAPRRPEPVPSPPKPSIPAIRETLMPEPASEPFVETPTPESISTDLAAIDIRNASSDEPIGGGSPSATAPDRLSGTRSSEEVADDRLARYVETIRASVEDRKRYPPLARRRSVEGRVLARVSIRVDGSLTAVEFDGDAPPLLRRATDEAIRSAAPYPAPPAGAITIELPVEYSLHDGA